MHMRRFPFNPGEAADPPTHQDTHVHRSSNVAIVARALFPALWKQVLLLTQILWVAHDGPDHSSFFLSWLFPGHEVLSFIHAAKPQLTQANGNTANFCPFSNGGVCGHVEKDKSQVVRIVNFGTC